MFQLEFSRGKRTSIYFLFNIFSSLKILTKKKKIQNNNLKYKKKKLFPTHSVSIKAERGRDKTKECRDGIFKLISQWLLCCCSQTKTQQKLRSVTNTSVSVSLCGHRQVLYCTVALILLFVPPYCNCCRKMIKERVTQSERQITKYTAYTTVWPSGKNIIPLFSSSSSSSSPLWLRVWSW